MCVYRRGKERSQLNFFLKNLGLGFCLGLGFFLCGPKIRVRFVIWVGKWAISLGRGSLYGLRKLASGLD